MITLQQVDYAYSRATKLLEEVTLHLESNHIYGILGKNGVGKSTLLKLIAGALTPLSGEITALGETPSKRHPSYLSQLYLLPEEVESIPLSMQRYAQLYAPYYPTFDHEKLQRLMGEFELAMTTRLNALSMGQRKKAMIAFAFACNTPLLLMDEPTNGLDIPSKSQFRRMIAAEATPQRCIVISTHQVRDLEHIIDSLVILDQQQVVVSATTAQLEQALQFRPLAYDGEPYIYHEQGKAVLPNITDEESRLDIELLFNATIHAPSEIAKQVNNINL